MNTSASTPWKVQLPDSAPPYDGERSWEFDSKGEADAFGLKLQRAGYSGYIISRDRPFTDGDNK
jgi:hypothetical protein